MKYWYLSLKEEALEATQNSDNKYGFAGGRRFTNPVRSGRHKGMIKNNSSLGYMRKRVSVGDWMVIGTSDRACALTQVKEIITKNGIDELLVAGHWLDSGVEFEATHELSVIVSHDPGVNINHLKRLSKRGNRQLGIMKNGEFVGRQGACREISESDAFNIKDSLIQARKQAQVVVGVGV